MLVTFKKTTKLPTHSVTIVVSSSLQSATAPDNKVIVYGTPKLTAKAQPTLAAAKSLLEVLESMTGTPSGLDSLALVGVKDLLVEGTDNWAIDVIRLVLSSEPRAHTDPLGCTHRTASCPATTRSSRRTSPRPRPRLTSTG